MNEAREGCDAQPSSPGHAEQPSEIETVKENGLSPAHHSKADEEIEENKTSSQPENERSEPEGEKTNETGYSIENDIEMESNQVNEDSSDDSMEVEETAKRKPNKTDGNKKSDIELNFNMRDKIFQDFMDSMGCSNVEQIQLQTEQLLAEVRTLNELAKEKEREWNNIIHLKKMKEELLLRLQRQKQVLMIGDKSDLCELEIIAENQADVSEERSSQSVLKSKNNLRRSNMKISKQRNSGKSHQFNNHLDLNGQSHHARQRNVVDVQSIIADYRQRHPEIVPRRGRRIRSIINSQRSSLVENNGKMSGVLNFSSITLGTGAQVRQNVISPPDANHELGLLINSMETVSKSL